MDPVPIRTADVARLLGCEADDIRDAARALRRGNLLAVEDHVLGPFARYLGGLADGDHAAVGDILCVHPSQVGRWRSPPPDPPRPRGRDHLIAPAAKYYELSGEPTGTRDERREREVARYAARLAELAAVPVIRWPPPAPPARESLTPDEWRFMVATFLTDDALADPGEALEERVSETPDDAAGRDDEARVRARLMRVHAALGRAYPGLAEVRLPAARWGDLYRRLSLPWLVLVWMLRYPVADWTTHP